MRFLKLFLFLIFLFVSANSVWAKDRYYKIVDTGKAYSYTFGNQYAWFEGLPKEIKERFYALPPENYSGYIPEEGDVGKLIDEITYTLWGEEKRIMILDVGGNPLKIGRSGVVEVSKEVYDSRLAKINSAKHEVFGLSLGQTSYREAQQILKQNGATFDPNYHLKNYEVIPMIKVNNYKNFPIVDERGVDGAWLYFTEKGILFKVMLYWYTNTPKIDGPTFKKISDVTFEGIRSKYKRKWKSDHINKAEDKKRMWKDNLTIERVKKGEFYAPSYIDLKYIYFPLNLEVYLTMNRVDKEKEAQRKQEIKEASGQF